MVRVKAPFDTAQYKLKMETTPSNIFAGEKTLFRFHVFHPKTGEQVKRFNASFDKPFHLFIISQDLDFYDHIHPTQEKDGSFITEAVVPKPGHYQIFSEFFPTDGFHQITRQTIAATQRGEVGHAYHSVKTQVSAESPLSKSVDGVRFELKLDPAQPVAGQPTFLKYLMVDDQTGVPIKDLQPYLGAWGHTVVLSEDGVDFLHSHPLTLIPPEFDRRKITSGPRVSFQTFFSRPGYYRIWSQFQRKDKIITVSFDVHASRLDRVAKWTNNRWSPLVDNPLQGFDGVARVLAVSGSDLYVGGDFKTIDGIAASGIAKWSGGKWHSLAGGVNGRVWALLVNGNDVYVGGDFTSAGNIKANRIAKWDSHVWSPLGNGVSGCTNRFCTPTVYSIACEENNVYVGGQFAMAGQLPANGIAKWDGREWTALGQGVKTGTYDGVVRALSVRGDELYAGGQFITAGDVYAYNIARWNGRNWFALDNGIRGNMEQVLAIAISGNDVYVGGNFTVAGGMKANNIAKWNGHGWLALGVQPRDGVRTIIAGETKVYVGGTNFTLPDGSEAMGIVQFDHHNWSRLGSGIGFAPYAGPVMGIAITGKDIYVSGDSFIMPTEKIFHPLDSERHDSNK